MISNLDYVKKLIKDYPKWGKEFLKRNPEYQKYIKL